MLHLEEKPDGNLVTLIQTYLKIPIEKVRKIITVFLFIE